MNINDFIRQVLSVTDEGWASLDAGLAYDQLTYANIMYAAERAMRWLAINAPVDMISGSDIENTPSLVVTVELTCPEDVDNYIPLPNDYLRLVRLRMDSWKRAVTESDVLREASDDFLMRGYDPQMGTEDHPCVAYIEGQVRKLFIIAPLSAGDTGVMEYASIPQISQSNPIPVPPKLINAFIYYTAYLLLVGYGDTKSREILSLVYNELGINVKQNAN